MSRRKAPSIGAKRPRMMSEKSLLYAGEELVWSGRPSAVGFAIRRAWWPLLVAIAFLTVSVGLFAKFGHPVSPPPADPNSIHPIAIIRMFQEMGIIFGVFSALAAIWLWLRAVQTTYMLTSRRVVIDTAGVLPRRTSMPLEHIRFIEYRSKLVGPVDLVFNETGRFSLDGWGLRGEGFIAIADAKHVEGLVRVAIEQTFSTRTRGPWQ
jgi:hypothetical protein